MSLRTINGKALSNVATRLNYAVNPTFRSTNATGEIRRNLAVDPAATKNTISSGQIGWAANWYGPGGSGANSLVTGATDGPFQGLSTYFRKTWTVAPTSPGDSGFSNTNLGNSGYPVSPGQVFSISLYARTNSATNKTFGIRVNWYDASGNSIQGWFTAPGVTLANYWQRVTYTTIAAPANAAYIAIWGLEQTGACANWSVGDTLDATGLLVEKGPIVGSYFDGTTTAQSGLTYSWSGTANASQPIATSSGTVEVRRNYCTTPGYELTQAGAPYLTNLLTNPGAETANYWNNNNSATWTVTRDTTTFRAGTQSVKSTAIANSTNVLSLYDCGGPMMPVTLNHWYTYSCYLRTDSAKAGSASVAIAWMDSTQTFMFYTYGTVVSTTIGQWTKCVVSAQAPSGAAYARVTASVTLAGGAVSGDVAWADSACFTEGISTENFDGTTVSTDPDFTYGWTGTANASTSTKSSVLNASLATNGNTLGVSSTIWKKNGTRSVRLMSQYAIGAGSGYYEFGTLGTNNWFLPGHTYTVSCYAYIDPANPLTALNAGFIYSESVVSGPNGGVNNIIPLSQTGEFFTSLTFTVSSTATAARIRFYNGQTQGGPSIWIDQMLIEEAPAVFPYFDGTTAAANDLTYSWLGTANNSISVATGTRTASWNPAAITGILYGSSSGRVKTWSGAVFNKVANSNVSLNRLSYTPLISAVPGDVWTASAYLFCATAQNATMSLTFTDNVNGGNSLATTTSTSTPIPANTWTRVSVTATAPAGTQAVYTQPTFTSVAAGTTVYFDDVLIEKAAGPAGVYFDGSLEENTTTSYRWLGTTDISTSEAVTKRPISILSADGVTWVAMSEFLKRINAWPNPGMERANAPQIIRTNLCTNPCFETNTTGWSSAPTYWTNAGATLSTDNTWFNQGTQSMKVVCDGTANQQGATYQFTGAANTPYAFSVVVKNDSGQPVQLNLRDTTNAINVNGSATTIAAGTTGTLKATITTGATANPNILIGVVTGTTAGAGTFHMDCMLIEKNSTVPGAYLDGSMAASGDFTYAWTGAANASSSVEKAPQPSSDANFNDLVAYGSTPSTKGWQATGAGKSGSKSFRLECRGSAGNGALLVFSQGLYSVPKRVPVNPGDAWSGRMSLRTTSGAAVPLSINLAYYSSGLLGYASTGNTITLPANGAWTEIVLPNTGVCPVGATSLEFLVYANAVLPAGTVIDIDGVYMEQVPVNGTPGAYFDGTTPTVRTNVVANPNFETGVAGWTSYAGTSVPVQSTSNPYSGTACLQAVGNNTSQAPRVFYNVTSGLYGGDTWTAQARIRMDGVWPTGAYIYCAIRWQLTGGGEVINVTSPTFTPDGTGYMLISATGSVPLNCSGTALIMFGFQGLASNLTSAGSLGLDNVMFEKSATVNTYCDTTALLPDFTYAWSGTANGSTSIATP